LTGSTRRSGGWLPLRETDLRVDMHAFDLGYGSEPFATLCRDHPGVETHRALVITVPRRARPWL
jgi:hypothetical protein